MPPSLAVCELHLGAEALQDLNSGAEKTNGAYLPDTLVSLFWCLIYPVSWHVTPAIVFTLEFAVQIQKQLVY